MIKFYTKVKSLLTVFLLILFCNSSFSQLIISQYYEGSSWNKFIEITNLGGDDLDLSAYKLRYWKVSGSGDVKIDFKSSYKEFALSGSLASGESIVVRNSRTTKTSINYSFARELKCGMDFNGNDGIVLVDKDGLILDIGINNVNGKDCSFVRNYDVTEANTTYDSSEWTRLKYTDVDASPKDNTNSLGFHSFSSSSVISKSKDIKSFVLDSKGAKINTTNNTIDVMFYSPKDVSSLVANIKVSAKASVSPKSGIAQDFSKPVVYTVTAEDGSSKQYTVNIKLLEKSNDLLLINEIDANQAGKDTHEFVELYDGGRGNVSLAGYVLVMYNGKGNKCYLSYDLSDYSTNEKGFFVLGSPLVANVDFSPQGFNLQNGPDAVALYKGDIADFRVNSMLTNKNLVDIVVYGSEDVSDMTDLLQNGSFVSESTNGDEDNHSVYRSEDGLGGSLNTSEFTAGLPTPGLTNTAHSSYPSLSLTSSVSKASENDKTKIIITVNSSSKCPEDQIVSISLTGDRVSKDDYSVSSNTLVIPKNTSKASISYTIVDDSELEGPEVFDFKISRALSSLISSEELLQIEVLDNDGFISAPFGTPKNPSFTKVGGLYNKDLYSGLNGKSGNELRLAIQSVIANENTKGQNYGDIWNMLKQADQNPENPFEVWLIYLEKGLKKTQQDGSAVGEVWNREHVWCQSLGSYKNGTSSSADGKDKFFHTSVNDLKHGHADGHHLRAAQKNENSSRGNKSFDDIDGPLSSSTKFYEPPMSAKGDIARAIMYMAVRYNGLSINEEPGVTGSKSIGKLSTLLKWHREDPVDDFEKNRNNKISEWQNNRNPFIDNPKLVDYIYGLDKGKVWTSDYTKTAIISNNTKGNISFTHKSVKQYTFSSYNTAEDTKINTQGPLEISLDNNKWSKQISLSATQQLTTNIFVRISSDILSKNNLDNATITHSSGNLEDIVKVSYVGAKQEQNADKQQQELSFTPLDGLVFGVADFELTASSNSSLQIYYKVKSGPALINGNIISITGAGKVILEASQLGNDNYTAANISVEFMIAKAKQTVLTDNINKSIIIGNSVVLPLTSDVGLPLTYKLIGTNTSMSSNVFEASSIGVVKLMLIQEGDDNFESLKKEISINVLEKDAIIDDQQVTGIEKAEIVSVDIFPNPASEYLFVNMNTNTKADILFYNSKGVLLKSRYNTTNTRFRLLDMPSGLYFVKINNSDINETKKIIIKK